MHGTMFSAFSTVSRYAGPYSVVQFLESSQNSWDLGRKRGGPASASATNPNIVHSRQTISARVRPDVMGLPPWIAPEWAGWARDELVRGRQPARLPAPGERDHSPRN